MSVIVRHLRSLVLEALGDTRVVVVLGARQVGKSTLVQDIARRDRPATILTLDDQATRDAAAADPTGFVAGLVTPVVIDEAQRVPDLLLAIKMRVDRDPAPGQFLLTGSANILTAPRIADALTGRAEYLRLAPFSQGELRGVTESFVPLLFDGHWPQITSPDVGRAGYAVPSSTPGRCPRKSGTRHAASGSSPTSPHFQPRDERLECGPAGLAGRGSHRRRLRRRRADLRLSRGC